MHFGQVTILLVAAACCHCATKGVRMTEGDPYEYLEAVHSPEVEAFVALQNQRTLETLSTTPRFEHIRSKLEQIFTRKDRIPLAAFRGGYAYNFWQDDEHPRGLYRRVLERHYTDASPPWEILLDVDALSLAENKKWTFKDSNCFEDSERCLISLSPDGGDAAEIREFDLNKKQFVADGFFVPTAKSNVCWWDRDHLFVSTDYGPGSMSTSGYPLQSRLWKRQTLLKDAPALKAAGQLQDMSAGVSVERHLGKRLAFWSVAHTFYTSTVALVDVPTLTVRPLPLPRDARAQGTFGDIGLFISRTPLAEQPAGTLFQYNWPASVDQAELKELKAIFVPKARAQLQSVAHNQKSLALLRNNGLDFELEMFHLKNGKLRRERTLSFPKGTAPELWASSDPSDERFWLTTNHHLQPLQFQQMDAGHPPHILKSNPAYFDFKPYVVETHEVKSLDGTAIPYSVIHHKDIKLNGQNPTVLYGYGGFEVSLWPSYEGRRGDTWFARGGVWVVAHIRGGGEFGPEWHSSAILANKQKSYDDFLAVAKDLIDRKITSPKKLGIQGGSNGGLLVLATALQRPDLFGAVVSQVPLADMLRYNRFLAGASWQGEYGDPDNPQDRAVIEKYSPYQNVHPAPLSAPKILLATSTSDDRVHPMHARKMAAKFEANGWPCLYRENTEGGHATAATPKQQAFEAALILEFLWQSLE